MQGKDGQGQKTAELTQTRWCKRKSTRWITFILLSLTPWVHTAVVTQPSTIKQNIQASPTGYVAVCCNGLWDHYHCPDLLSCQMSKILRTHFAAVWRQLERNKVLLQPLYTALPWLWSCCTLALASIALSLLPVFWLHRQPEHLLWT